MIALGGNSAWQCNPTRNAIKQLEAISTGHLDRYANFNVLPMSALPPIADMAQDNRDVRFVP
jgi:hypothetical protein